MKHPTQFTAAGSTCVAVLLLLTTAGCGTGTYNDLVTRAQSKLKNQAGRMAMLAKLGGYTTIAGTNLNIRPPAEYSKLPAKNSDGSEPLPEELYPAGVKPPGYFATYEKAIPRQRGETTVMIYIAGGAAPESGEAIRAELAGNIKTAIPGASETWESLQLPTPDKSTVDVEKLSVQGPVQFRTKQNVRDNTADIIDEAGTIEFYYFQSNGSYALVGWACPDKLLDFCDVREVAQYMAGTLQSADATATTPAEPNAEGADTDAANGTATE